VTRRGKRNLWHPLLQAIQTLSHSSTVCRQLGSVAPQDSLSRRASTSGPLGDLHPATLNARTCHRHLYLPGFSPSTPLAMRRHHYSRPRNSVEEAQSAHSRSGIGVAVHNCGHRSSAFCATQLPAAVPAGSYGGGGFQTETCVTGLSVTVTGQGRGRHRRLLLFVEPSRGRRLGPGLKIEKVAVPDIWQRPG
jgi:hypothetical protein